MTPSPTPAAEPDAASVAPKTFVPVPETAPPSPAERAADHAAESEILRQDLLNGEGPAP